MRLSREWVVSFAVGGLVSCGAVTQSHSQPYPTYVVVGTGSPADGGTDAGSGDAGPTVNPVCVSKVAPPCQDQAILALDLKKPVAPGLITSSAVDGGYVSVVDATAGSDGLSPVTDSFVYGKFTSAGLTKVAVGDEAALDSMDWDIAFRRYVVRLNGGPSGPSCVGASALPVGTSYDALAAVSSGAGYAVDAYYADTPAACTFVADSAGLGTSPATALSSYYQYPNQCVQMTSRVYAVQTADGHHLKLTLDGYYFPVSAQVYCNTYGSKQGGSVSATLTLRWAFLD